MTSEEKLIEECNQHEKASFIKVKAKWPYDYNDNMGYLVSYEGRKEKLYFYFNDEGMLLDKSIVRG